MTSPSYVAIITSVIAASSAIICAWITVHVRRVERAVNGHTAKLERKISELRRALDEATRS